MKHIGFLNPISIFLFQWMGMLLDNSTTLPDTLFLLAINYALLTFHLFNSFFIQFCIKADIYTVRLFFNYMQVPFAEFFNSQQVEI